MKHLLVRTALLLGTVAATGCAGFEQSLSSLTPTGPSTIGAALVPSLVGTWNSASTSATGSSCTNFQWRVTAQSGSGLTGDFSVDCVGGISASGVVSGQLTGTDVPYQATGTATVVSGLSCPFSITGTAHIEGDAIRIPYEGSTCLGPLRGEEVLRRPAQPTPTPTPAPAPSPAPVPAPDPPAPAGPSPSAYHVGPGPLSSSRAYDVVKATAAEYSQLTAARNSEAESLAATSELQRRMIWHLQLAGFQAGRQKNPSGAISGDKLTVLADGAWHAYDVFRDVGTPGVPATVIFWEVFPANPVADGGIPD